MVVEQKTRSITKSIFLVWQLRRFKKHLVLKVTNKNKTEKPMNGANEWSQWMGPMNGTNEWSQWMGPMNGTNEMECDIWSSVNVRIQNDDANITQINQSSHHGLKGVWILIWFWWGWAWAKFLESQIYSKKVEGWDENWDQNTLKL